MGTETDFVEAGGPASSEDDLGRVDSVEEDSVVGEQASEEPTEDVQAGTGSRGLMLGDRLKLQLVIRYPNGDDTAWIDMSCPVTSDRMADLRDLTKDLQDAAKAVIGEINKRVKS